MRGWRHTVKAKAHAGKAEVRPGLDRWWARVSPASSAPGSEALITRARRTLGEPRRSPLAQPSNCRKLLGAIRAPPAASDLQWVPILARPFPFLILDSRASPPPPLRTPSVPRSRAHRWVPRQPSALVHRGPPLARSPPGARSVPRPPRAPLGAAPARSSLPVPPPSHAAARTAGTRASPLPSCAVVPRQPAVPQCPFVPRPPRAPLGPAPARRAPALSVPSPSCALRDPPVPPCLPQQRARR